MKILFIAPLPPPVTGHSLAAKVFKDDLTEDNTLEVVNLSKDSFEQGLSSLSRIKEILGILKEVKIKKKNADIVYFTISESLLGNIKDLFIYLICYKKLSRMVIHLHGGSIKRLLFDKNRFIYAINRFFIKKTGAAIVLGQSHVDVFSPILPADKIHIVPNFSEDYLFLDKAAIKAKFDNNAILNILFLSNLIDGKGHNELLDAFLALDDILKLKVTINFAGAFESEKDKKNFLAKSADFPQIIYHGVVKGDEKKDLLSKAHVFCLPTSLFEGQPISILEAYASGCVVVTTDPSGIKDIFINGTNGFEIEKRSSESIRIVIEQMLEKPGELFEIGTFNRNIAETKYRTSIYNTSLRKIINEVRAYNQN